MDLAPPGNALFLPRADRRLLPPGSCWPNAPPLGTSALHRAGRAAKERKAFMLSGSVVSSSLWLHAVWPTRLLCPRDAPGKSTGVGCNFILQGIFPTGIKLSSPALAGRFFTTKPQRKPQNGSKSEICFENSTWLIIGLPWWLKMAQGDLGSIPGSGRSPEEDNGAHSSVLAWRIPWTEEPGGLQPMGSQRIGRDWVTKTLTLMANYMTQNI